MRNSKEAYPPFGARIGSVWFRHMRVYTRNLISNGLPPFLEPLIFLLGIGLGLGRSIEIGMMGTSSYVEFLAPGLFITTAMFTSSFECSFGTFIRLEFDKVYDGMLASPIKVQDLLLGEILWAGTKGFFFSCAVLFVVSFFGVVNSLFALVAPLLGFCTGIMFASLSLFVTSFVKTINHFNFYFTGFLSPMFFFAGVVFPIENLPPVLREVAEVFPLTHTVRLSQAFTLFRLERITVLDIVYIPVFIIVVSFFAVRRLTKRLVD